jgi:hypothetical protein
MVLEHTKSRLRTEVSPFPLSVPHDLTNTECQYWPGSRAERPISSSAPRGGGDGDPPCALAYRRWGPIYIAIHTQRLELWAHFFEVLRLLMGWESQ